MEHFYSRMLRQTHQSVSTDPWITPYWDFGQIRTPFDQRVQFLYDRAVVQYKYFQVVHPRQVCSQFQVKLPRVINTQALQVRTVTRQHLQTLIRYSRGSLQEITLDCQWLQILAHRHGYTLNNSVAHSWAVLESQMLESGMLLAEGFDTVQCYLIEVGVN